MAKQPKSDAQKTVSKLVDSVTKDLPKLVKENKGAAIGAAIGYLLADKLSENNEISSSILGGLVGAFVDEKKTKF